jgi:hypothetical protein
MTERARSAPCGAKVSGSVRGAALGIHLAEFAAPARLEIQPARADSGQRVALKSLR